MVNTVVLSPASLQIPNMPIVLPDNFRQGETGRRTCRRLAEKEASRPETGRNVSLARRGSPGDGPASCR